MPFRHDLGANDIFVLTFQTPAYAVSQRGQGRSTADATRITHERDRGLIPVQDAPVDTSASFGESDLSKSEEDMGRDEAQ
jgi:hypothetical protein